MYFSGGLLICAQLLVQSISAQCIGAIGTPLMTAPLAAAPCVNALGTPYAAAEWAYAPVASLAASNGPGLTVATASPLIPAGISVLSNNDYEGVLAVGGALPFLGTIALEGPLPTAGAGAVTYGCGNGAVVITDEDIGAIGFGDITGSLGYDTFGAALAPLPLVDAPLAADTLGFGPLIGTSCAAPGIVAEVPFAPVASLAASNGPGVAVSTVSPLLPAGVSVLSENAYDGALAAGGTLPFLGTVALEGALPTAGVGAVAYGCGNGAVAITAEDIGTGFGNIAGPLGYNAGPISSLDYGSALTGPIGITGPACGYGIMY